jgi:hypothetical protein
VFEARDRSERRYGHAEVDRIFGSRAQQQEGVRSAEKW